ncbi:MAG: 3-phosphoshikimate 1-carboxyvinyltransferase [Gemmatimonadota bacterium]|nr:3-phosphoshikimate 1-carboxyvinyltransferase [Gemmatimonadota bacterium]
MHGTVRAPGDKSITHRALMLAALSRGTSVVRHPLTSADARSTAACLRELGVGVGPLRAGAAVSVQGGTWRPATRTLHCGNAGTTARLMLGLLAAHPFETRLTGDASLRRRPMRRVTEPLGHMGASIREEAGDGLPLRIRGGRLGPLDWSLPVATAQVKSALLLAGLAGGVAVTVREPARSRDHTERMFRAMGVPLTRRGTTAALAAAPGWFDDAAPLDWTVVGDVSSAAFLVAAGLMAERGEVRIAGVGLNPTRTGFLTVLSRMGARIEREAQSEVHGEPVGDLVVAPSALVGTVVTASEIPSLIDEIPILAVLASRAQGETVFHEVGELRVKESDRLGLLAENLRQTGVGAEVAGNSLTVEGTERPPRGHVETAGDHRLAMAFAVLGRLSGARVALSEQRSVAVSYPAFFEDLDRITGP